MINISWVLLSGFSKRRLGTFPSMTLTCPMCDLTLRYVLQIRGLWSYHSAQGLPYTQRIACFSMQLMLQAILAHLEGDIGPELRASGFEREHEITLEQWAVQQPAEREDAIGARAVESIPDSEEGTDSAVSSSERQDDVSCEGSSRLHISGESESKPHCLEGLQQRLRSAEISGSQGSEMYFPDQELCSFIWCNEEDLRGESFFKHAQCRLEDGDENFGSVQAPLQHWSQVMRTGGIQMPA